MPALSLRISLAQIDLLVGDASMAPYELMATDGLYRRLVSRQLVES